MRAAFEFRHYSIVSFDDQSFENLTEHEALRCVSLTLKNWRAKGCLTIYYGYLRLRREDSRRATSNAGLRFVREQHQSGVLEVSFISNMQKQASARSWRRT